MHLHHEELKLARRTPVYDHANVWLYDADRDIARSLMKRGDILPRGSKTRVRSLKFLGPDPALLFLSGSHRRRPIETPYRHASPTNVNGVWTFDRISESWRPHFYAVVSDCLKEQAA